MSADRNRDARRAVEDGLRRVASELGPDTPAHLAHLRVRLPQGADADAVARAIRTALGRSALRSGENGSGPQGVERTGQGAP
jgi:hypothetical protein